MSIVAILLVSFAWDIGGHNNVAAFITMLVGVIFIGMSCNYGSSVFLGYMERMPPWQISSWSSGTGLSGVAASLIFLGLTSASMTNAQIFLLSIVFVIVYWLMYFFGLKLPFCVPESSASTTEGIALFSFLLSFLSSAPLPLPRVASLRIPVLSVLSFFLYYYFSFSPRKEKKRKQTTKLTLPRFFFTSFLLFFLTFYCV
ncbi:battenin [Trypanosoma conorhini]|uniref:Battenin n=1 Tax=Trypanosoma conorhini TaxID=83891 RepID=A0A3R7PGT7_9TRYP|nr:battenin [Trypanosoma conorhini]RNF25122.1 battenin [Trypanosoma conorhini]